MGGLLSFYLSIQLMNSLLQQESLSGILGDSRQAFTRIAKSAEKRLLPEWKTTRPAGICLPADCLRLPICHID